MTWTFGGDPSASARDHVRMLIGDIDVNDQLVTDELIEAVLALEGNNVYLAAAKVCRSLVARFSRDVDTSVDGVSDSASQRVRHFRDLAADLAREAGKQAIFGAQVFVGGVGSRAPRSPIFEIGMHDDSGWDRPA